MARWTKSVHASDQLPQKPSTIHQYVPAAMILLGLLVVAYALKG